MRALARSSVLVLAVGVSAPVMGQIPLTNQDDCANAIVEAVVPGIYTFDTTLATTGVQESQCSILGGSFAIDNDIWFIYTATSTCTTITTCNSAGTLVDTKIAAYPGTTCPMPGTSLGCSDNQCGPSLKFSSIHFLTMPGSSYLIQVGSSPDLPVGGTGAVEILDAVTPSLSPLHTFYGDSTGNRFGESVSGAGDVNADGFDDIIVGAPRDSNNGTYSGSARVLSGVDGGVLYTFDGDTPGIRFGYSVSGAGDVNADGFGDIIVGASLDDNDGHRSGSARVFSGVDGSILYTFDGDSPDVWFGYSVSGAGDVNADGYDDLIVGGPVPNQGGNLSGYARVFSGVDGSILYTFNGNLPDDRFGKSVSGAGDVNADGYDDVIVGTGKPQSGIARVFSGVDGSTLYTFDGNQPYDRFGDSVSGAGDVNGDGYGDLIVGAYRAHNNGPGSGSARVFSGVDGSVLYTFNGDWTGDGFGGRVSGASDVNRDGFDDFIVGTAPEIGSGDGYARAFSGVDGGVLHLMTWGCSGASFAVSTSVSGAGDVDGDGFDDLLVGVPGELSGSVRVFSGRTLSWSYCNSVINSTGLPGTMLALGSGQAVTNDVTLIASQLPPNQLGYFLTSQTQGFFMPPGSLGVICLGGNIGRYNGNIGQGPTFSLQIDLTSMPVNPPQAVVPGETWNFQCWYRDIGNTNNFTDAVSVTFN